MWMVEDALEGRVTIGKSRAKQGDQTAVIRLPQKRLYHLQKFLEEAAEKGGNFFEARMAVMLWESLREGLTTHRDETEPH